MRWGSLLTSRVTRRNNVTRFTDAVRGSVGDENDNPPRVPPPRRAEGGIKRVKLRLWAITASRRDEGVQLPLQDGGILGEWVRVMYGPQITLLPMVAKGDNTVTRIAAFYIGPALNFADPVIDKLAHVVDVRLLAAGGIVNKYNITG
jgi:hypothetical protein